MKTTEQQLKQLKRDLLDMHAQYQETNMFEAAAELTKLLKQLDRKLTDVQLGLLSILDIL